MPPIAHNFEPDDITKSRNAGIRLAYSIGSSIASEPTYTSLAIKESAARDRAAKLPQPTQSQIATGKCEHDLLSPTSLAAMPKSRLLMVPSRRFDDTSHEVLASSPARISLDGARGHRHPDASATDTIRLNQAANQSSSPKDDQDNDTN